MSTIKSGKAGHKSWVSKKSHQIGETLLDSGLEFWVGSILFLWSYPRVRFTTRKDRERGGGLQEDEGLNDHPVASLVAWCACKAKRKRIGPLLSLEHT